MPTPQIVTHYVLERAGFVALVEKRPDGGFGGIGAPALLNDGAFAVLVWKESGPMLVAKGQEFPATAEQVDALRQFDGDLKQALKSSDK